MKRYLYLIEMNRSIVGVYREAYGFAHYDELVAHHGCRMYQGGVLLSYLRCRIEKGEWDLIAPEVLDQIS